MTRHQWSTSPADQPDIYHLHHGPIDTPRGAPVASVWWLHDPDHLAVVMARIVDRLNLPAAECRPSPDPVWTLQTLPCTEGTIPAGWGTYLYHGVEVMAVIWTRHPRNLDGWHQRILDALNPGRGLPAVKVPTLTRSAA